MKRNRAGEDELNPSRNNNRSVFGQPGEAGEDRAGRGRDGGQGLGAVQERGATDTPGLVTPGLKPEDSASSLSASGPPLLNHHPPGGGQAHHLLPGPSQGWHSRKAGPLGLGHTVRGQVLALPFVITPHVT